MGEGIVTLREIWIGWLLFLLPLIPTFFQYRKGENLGDIYFASDRYAYLASIGLLYIVALGIVYLARKSEQMRRWITTFILFIVFIFSFLSYVQSRVWSDTDALFRHVLTLYPNSQIAHVNIGNAEQRAGNFDAALEHYQASIRIHPTALAYYNLGKLYLQLGMNEQAVEANRKAMMLDESMELAYVNLGVAYVRTGRDKEALGAFLAASMIAPDSIQAHFNAGALYQKEGKTKEAIEEYRRVLAIDPKMSLALTRITELTGSP